jgi:hypothetical protein
MPAPKAELSLAAGAAAGSAGKQKYYCYLFFV